MEACKALDLTREPRPHNPNQDKKHRPRWFDDDCRLAQRALWTARRTKGPHNSATRAASRTFRQACRRAARRARAALPHLLK